MTAQAAGGAGDLAARIAAIEEAYEFMLAYAAQGYQRGVEGDHIRDFLNRADAALTGIAPAAAAAVAAARAEAAAYDAFLAVLDDDARKAQACLRLALAQRAIGSQVVDNLNASIHLRALLTDLFLIDEAIGASRS